MARALVYHERHGTEWKPVGVFLGTAKRLDHRMLPGDSRRDAWAASMSENTRPPYADGVGISLERGTWEDWIGWALGALSNGHDVWMTEVTPEPSVEALFQREILGVKSPPVPTGQTGADEIPELSGYKKVRPVT